MVRVLDALESSLLVADFVLRATSFLAAPILMSGAASNSCSFFGAGGAGFGGGGGGIGGGNGGGLGVATLDDPPPKHILILHLLNDIFYDRALTCTIHDSGEVISWRRVYGWEYFVEFLEHGI